MGISISGLKVGHKEFKDGYEQFANGPDSVGGVGVQFSSVSYTHLTLPTTPYV